MSAEIVQLYPKDASGHDEALTSLLSRLLGLLLTRGKLHGVRNYHATSRALRIRGVGSAGRILRVDVWFECRLALRCTIFDLRQYGGFSRSRVLIAYQSRGGWEDAVGRIAAPDIPPAVCMRDWIF